MRPLPDGYEIRPPTFDDVEGVDGDAGCHRPRRHRRCPSLDADFIRDQWSAPGFELSEDAWVITDPNGTIVGYANLSPDGEGKVKSWGVVHPRPSRSRTRRCAPRSVGGPRLRSPARHRGRGPPHRRQRRRTRPPRRWCGSRGFEHVRTFRHLQIDLDGSPRDPGEPPAGIRDPRGSSPNATSAGSTRSSWRRSAGSGATARSPSRSGSDWRSRRPATTRACGCSRPTGTRRSVRSRASYGATAVGSTSSACGHPGADAGSRRRLLRRAFATFASRGLPRVMLNVDSENSTGAVRLYEGVGMRTLRAWDVYEKRVV